MNTINKIKQFFVLSYQIVRLTFKILFKKFEQKQQSKRWPVTGTEFIANITKAGVEANIKFKEDFLKEHGENPLKVRDKQLDDIYTPCLEVKEYSEKDLKRLEAMAKFIKERKDKRPEHL